MQTPEKTRMSDLPHTPATTPTKSANRSCYAQARSVLRLSASSTTVSLPLLGRDTQRDQILAFISSASAEPSSSAFQLRRGGALYVSGQPGTGKTALVTDILERTLPATLPKLFLNCATVKGIQVWETILDAVNGEPAGLKGLRARKRLEELIQQNDKEPL